MRDTGLVERRCVCTKSARRRAVAPDSPLDSVASLAGATSPCRTPTPRQRAVWRNHDDPDWSKTALIQRRIDRRAVTVAILAAQRDEALLHRGDPALHRGVVDTVDRKSTRLTSRH